MHEYVGSFLVSSFVAVVFSADKAPRGCNDASIHYIGECNMCWCTDRNIMCTVILDCDFIKESEVTTSQNQSRPAKCIKKCVNGAQYSDECNTCTCEDGMTICTRIACDSLVENEFGSLEDPSIPEQSLSQMIRSKQYQQAFDAMLNTVMKRTRNCSQRKACMEE